MHPCLPAGQQCALFVAASGKQAGLMLTHSQKSLLLACGLYVDRFVTQTKHMSACLLATGLFVARSGSE
jgi:hypothetical protein